VVTTDGARAASLGPCAKRRRGSRSSGNHHVAAQGDDDDSRVCVDVPQRGKAPWVALSSHLHGETSRAAFGNPDRTCPAKQGTRRYGSDRGARGSARLGTPEKDTERQPEEAHRSGSGIVKCQVHRSPGRGCRLVGPGARRKSRRDAGSARGTGTRSRSSGKQKSVVHIEFELRGTPQGKP